MKNILLWIIRILVGALFIFSGLIKANDPVGFAIKLQEYFEVFSEAGPAFSFFSSEWLMNSTVFLATFICVLEVALGVCLLIGSAGKLVAWLLLLMMIFFTWLTGYSAITGKVTDCGCFGDAIPLTPWQSFEKDIVLTILILYIFALRKHIKPVFSRVFAFVVFFAGAAFTLYVAVHALQHDVFKDFRPYAVGENIRKNMEIPADAPKGVVEMNYIYKNKSTGATEEIKMRTDEDSKKAMDRITALSADKNWEFAERKDKIIKAAFKPKISDFAVIDENEDDITEKVLTYDDYMFMVVSDDLDKTNTSAWDKINELQQAAEKEGIFTFGFVSASREKIEDFRHERNTEFPIYKGDYKVSLTITRINPGVVLLKNGTVIGKWAWRDLPAFSDIKREYFAERPVGEITFLEDDNAEIFAEGEDILTKINASREPYNGFVLADKDGNDFTQPILADSVPVYMLIFTDITKVTQESYGAMLPLMQQLQTAGAKWFVVSVSDAKLVEQMADAADIDFTFYNSDGDLLKQIMPENTGIIILKNGTVVKKYHEGQLPDAAQLMAQ